MRLEKKCSAWRWPLPKRVKAEYFSVASPIDLLRVVEWCKSRGYHGGAVEFMAYCGCRPCDVAGLTRDRLFLDAEQPHAFIRQFKTGQPTYIALAPSAVAAVRRALARSTCNYVFARGGKTLTALAIQQEIRRASVALGLTVSAKSFRRAVVAYLQK